MSGRTSTGRLYRILATVSGSYPDFTGRLPRCYSPVRR